MLLIFCFRVKKSVNCRVKTIIELSNSQNYSNLVFLISLLRLTLIFQNVFQFALSWVSTCRCYWSVLIFRSFNDSAMGLKILVLFKDVCSFSHLMISSLKIWNFSSGLFIVKTRLRGRLAADHLNVYELNGFLPRMFFITVEFCEIIFVRFEDLCSINFVLKTKYWYYVLKIIQFIKYC